MVGESGNCALAGTNPWPVSTDEALAVAALIDQARSRTIR